MSKNYELLKQAGLEREPGPTAAFKITPSLVPGRVPANGEGLNLDEFAREEAFKLVQRVFLTPSTERPRIVVFASIDHGDGCSRICAQVSKTLASSVAGSVCIVDGNLRSSLLPDLFGVGNHRGLTDALSQEDPVRSFAQRVRPDNLWLLSCGSLAANSPTLLKSDRLKARLTELRAEFDHVVIDAPPLNQYADSLALGQLADGIVLVLEANSTRREAARKVTEGLRNARVPILGAVLNKRTFPIPEVLYRKL